jgi:NhaP-type Na+/H+ or K+/H+ antiporter
MTNEQLQYIFIAAFLLFLALFFFVETCIEHYNPPIGHTTGVVIVVGIGISAAVYGLAQKYSEDQQWLDDLEFDDDLFFYFVLPLIIFPSGYNMRRKKFFSNIGTIMKFGFLGTIICFAVYTALCYGASEADLLTKPNPDGPGTVKVDFQIYEILSVCSLLCSSDVIAAISMVSYKEQPKLFSIIYGEGVFNDIVSIILFNTV